MQDRAPFKDRLRRSLKGFSRADFLTTIDVSERALTGWLKGTNEPNAAILANICIALNVSADWLLGFSDEWGPCPLVTQPGG